MLNLLIAKSYKAKTVQCQLYAITHFNYICAFFSTTPSIKLFIHYTFFFFLLQKHILFLWVCHDLVKTKMDSRQRKKKIQNVKGITSSTLSSFFSILSMRNHCNLSYSPLRDEEIKYKIPFGTKETHIGLRVPFQENGR